MSQIHMTIKQAQDIAGTLSNPSKMPCKGTSLPASKCKTGMKLRGICGSVCEKCYAHKGMYVFGNVQAALEKRLSGIYHPLWIDAMVKMIGKADEFRWHDSGDVQSEKHLDNICKVCWATPDTDHWLPTKERAILFKYLKHNKIPPNLTIRLSASMIDQRPPSVPEGVLTSTVHSDTVKYGVECKAYEREGRCDDCRACWDKTIPNISYPQH